MGAWKPNLLSSRTVGGLHADGGFGAKLRVLLPPNLSATHLQDYIPSATNIFIYFIHTSHTYRCVPGYTAPAADGGTGWMYSTAMISVLQEYKLRYKWVWSGLDASGNDGPTGRIRAGERAEGPQVT